MSTEFWIQIVIYAVSIGTFAGIVLTRLNYLEKKMDQHNCLVSKVAGLEKEMESMHYRINELRDELK